MGEVDFNFIPGDLVREVATKSIYKVTDVYPHFILCVDFEGHKDSFNEANYICKDIVKVARDE